MAKPRTERAGLVVFARVSSQRVGALECDNAAYRITMKMPVSSRPRTGKELFSETRAFDQRVGLPAPRSAAAGAAYEAAYALERMGQRAELARAPETLAILEQQIALLGPALDALLKDLAA